MENDELNAQIVNYGDKLTSVQMSFDDWDYVKKNRLKFSELMRIAIAQDRAVRNGDIVNNVSIERQAKEKFMELNQKILQKFGEKMDSEEFDNIVREL